MSTLKADTIVASDGTSPVTLTKQSAAKAWGYFVHVGGVPTGQDSLNVSSYTDNGTGYTGVNFSASMNNSNFSTVATQQNHGSALTNNPVSGKTTSSTNILGRASNNSGIDTEQNWLVTGDLA